MRLFRSGASGCEIPHWYWTRGLHDALVIRTEATELPYDVGQRDPIRNCFTIHLDASGAMFDTSVKGIKLFNFKILQDDSATGGYGKSLDGCYWMQDTLTWEKGKYLLNITALGENNFHFAIRFDTAQVEHK